MQVDCSTLCSGCHPLCALPALGLYTGKAVMLNVSLVSLNL